MIGGPKTAPSPLKKDTMPMPWATWCGLLSKYTMTTVKMPTLPPERTRIE